MAKKYDRLMKKIVGWMESQHDEGIEWISMQAIYEATNKKLSPKQGLTQQQLSNKLPKHPNIVKGPVAAATGATLNLGYQLTTQSQTNMIQTSDKSVIASGNVVTSKFSSSAIVAMITDTNNLNPTNFQIGYLIATETLYLSTKTDVEADDAFTTNVILECSVEKLDERAAMSLALSQS